MRLSFGKFKGFDISELPDSYLLWLNFQSDFLSDRFLSETTCEVERRWPDRIPVRYLYIRTPDDHKADDRLPEKVKAVYRRLSLEFHPDRTGGDVEKMKALNRFMDELRNS